ncbi:unnamed protein product [Didymodactylos carnosus]|uniref:NADPH oxidase n=1 Tax=Didymodactylos carnosus TaxID=1234261 RepID=A0A814SMJ7_9BILA|nr:unnamed protein product [Didymodactylos carnosus]CAF1150111.1 unnamed protein product [Didymodactylos carnosus]CAF3608191.1 unnamed protein product [Didymodactylos carnosus]CAF3913672.1 unnamed protein product [Didymodactylos carnosus]
MLNFNCALMLVLMLRKHITWLRTKGAVILLPLDYHIDLHKIIGIILLCETILHTLAHIAYLIYVFKMCPLPKDIGYVCQNNPSLNSTKFYRYDSRLDYCVPFDYKGCGGNLNKFSTEALCTLRCSVYKYSHHHITELFFTAKIGFGYFTGIVELLLLALIYVMCLPFVRKGGHFQLFYWCHMLTLPWLGIMLLHGPRFWKWLLAPALLYTIEKILRYRKSRSHKHGETYIMEAILLPSQVIHLVISKPRKFIYKPGDYIYINIPAVAHCEWHPFSISSAPEHKDSIWLHVRACGHWTRRVYELFRQKLKQQHGGILDDYSDLRLRISMRSRMSRSYIEELRGIEKNNNQSDSRLATLNNKVYPGSFTMPKHTHESMSVTRRSMASLREVKLQRITETDSGQFNDDNSENIRMMSKTVVLDPNNLTNMTTDENEKIDYDQEGTIDINSIRATTSPTVEFKSSQIRNSISVTTNNGRSSFNIRIPKTPDDDSQERPSDALGYLRMYKDRNRIDFESLQFNEREDLQILIDGPYGAPSQHIFEAEHAVLIAAGIGITPFASILQSIMCRYRNRRHKCPKCHSIWNNSADHEQLAVRKVDFIWVTRDQRSLEWFISLLSQMEIEQKRLRAGEHEDPLLEVHLYVTSARRLSDLKALNVYLSLDLVEHKENNRDNWDAVDGIRRRTKHGRPDWDQVFTELLCQKKGKISVFYCGPPALVPDLNDKCKQYGFAFKKELF